MEIIAFCCHNSLTDVDFKDSLIRMVLLSCSSKIEVSHLLLTLEQGVDGIMVVACRSGECQFQDGDILAKGRVLYTKRLVSEIGLEEERIAFFSVSGKDFLEVVKLMKDKLAVCGPNPLKEKGYA